MTDECPFYETYQIEFNIRKISSDRRARTKVEHVPWCSHDESPVTRKDTQMGIGAGSKLKCGGDFDKCPIADKL